MNKLRAPIWAKEVMKLNELKKYTWSEGDYSGMFELIDSVQNGIVSAVNVITVLSEQQKAGLQKMGSV
ncbi:hypothetical protein BWQ96_04794 [Gracilariopsis chorda]|uniref:Uncharacterized protein n=1 Tax=Gracilariopsis chorda TaxID=448386 RepID=A0A2V3ITP0_9FLOR|nr:hypothetical protein BWQ96_04794 [Gracilariopsis chorda]|eukprot:PXF45496.1 hypothetical protein BWQ96_04794 [Gracilariopsis chorda]